MHNEVACRAVFHRFFQCFIANVVESEAHFLLIGFDFVSSVQIGDVATVKSLHADGYARQWQPFGIGNLSVNAFTALVQTFARHLHVIARDDIGARDLIEHLSQHGSHRLVGCIYRYTVCLLQYVCFINKLKTCLL